MAKAVENESKKDKEKHQRSNEKKALDTKDILLKKIAKEQKKEEDKLKKEERKKVRKYRAEQKKINELAAAEATEGNIYSKFKRIWITKDIAATMGRDIELKLVLRGVIHFAIFFTFVTIVCVSNISKFDYYLTRVLNVQFEIDNLNQVHSQTRFWIYLEDVFLNAIYYKTWKTNDKDEKDNDNDYQTGVSEAIQENTLLGAPRMKQVRVRNGSCIVHKYFSAHFKSCYGEYSSSSEDKEPYGPQIGTEWTYNTASETGSPANKGKIAWYGGGGYYCDLSTSKARTRQLLKELKDQLWVNRGTRAVTIHFSVYNTNLNLFSLVEFMFEFPPTGGILATYSITTVKIIRYVTSLDYLILAVEIIMYGYLIYFTLEEIRDVSVLKWSYFGEFWSYIELAIIIDGYILMAIGMFRFGFVRRIMKRHKEHPDKYLNFEYIADLMTIFNNCSAALMFLTYVKVFKFININKTMGQLNVTIAKCRKDVAGFAIMFMIIFIAFSALGYLLFGSEAESFNDFGYAMLTLLKTILGEFDYSEIERANPLLAPFFFVLFIFLVFFVLLNMFLAIINDTYTDVKTEIASSSSELEMSTIISRGCFNFARKLGYKGLNKKKEKEKSELTVTLDEIKDVLKSCGFTDLEIEMFFQRYNIDPTVKVEQSNANYLLAELKRKYSTDKGEEPDGPVVPIIDFIQQQRRLEKIERAVGKLSNSLQILLRKLESLESVKRYRNN